MGERIALFIPHYGALDLTCPALVSHSYAIAPSSPHFGQPFAHGDARLTFNFNAGWCHALNMVPRPTRFVMQHTDVKPLTPCWLDVLEAERARCGADVLSVLLPLKNDEGHSSTMVEDRKTGRVRRLSMAEALGGPMTFDAAALGFPDYRMLFSTGLWICDFTKRWVEKVCFQVRDRIMRQPGGEFAPEQVEEAWTFAHQLYSFGARIMTTRCVAALHVGDREYSNQEPGRGPVEPWEPEISWWREK